MAVLTASAVNWQTKLTVLVLGSILLHRSHRFRLWK